MYSRVSHTHVGKIITEHIDQQVQGYALTESCCAGTIQFQNDPRDGVVGPPAASVEICLASCTEVCDRDGKPYLDTDTSHYGLPCRGRGEVLIRGHSVSSGYLKKIEKTQKEFDKYGYFHTGDIAIFTTDGCIKIVDRLKNLVKLKGGEYIALESMEKEYVENHIKITQTSVCSNMKTELLHSRKTQQIREKYLCRR